MKVFINGATVKLRPSANDTAHVVVTFPIRGAHFAGHPVGTEAVIIDGIPVEDMVLCKIGRKQHYVSVENIAD